MDDFGVLVKHYGINPKGKSAPMAASKKAPKTQNTSDFVNQDPNFFPQSFSKSNSGGGSVFVDQNDDMFGFNSGHKGQSNVSGDVFDDFFQIPTQSSGMCTRGSGGGGGGVGFDMESVFKGSVDSGAKSSGVNGGDDDIWGFSENSSTNTNVGVEVGSNGDLLSSDPVDDFWGKMAKLSLDQRGVKRLGENKGGNDDLIPGFDGSFTLNNRAQTSVKEKDPGVSSLEELENFATRKINNDTNGHGASFTVKNPRKTVNHKPDETNFFDFDVSVGGSSVQKEKMENVDILFQTEPTDLDSFFPSQTKKSTPISENSAMNTNTYKEPDLFSGNAFGTDKKVSSGVFPDDFMFEGSSATEVFQEIKGESDERRNLRFARHQRAKARMENALAEMNEREFKAQQEQEEKHRIADAMSVEMKRWAAGKEGNLRALLSSLQQVLGPEFGWRPVSITDLITSSQVKIAYKKAALCIHPDKVQQRGANLEQKFVAEKAFDLLKEAWNKFSSEELR